VEYPFHTGIENSGTTSIYAAEPPCIAYAKELLKMTRFPLPPRLGAEPHMMALIEGRHHRMDSKLFSTLEPQVEMHLLDYTIAEGKLVDVQFYISAMTSGGSPYIHSGKCQFNIVNKVDIDSYMFSHSESINTVLQLLVTV